MDVYTVVSEKIHYERLRQDEKWGEQNHDNYRWIAIATEELGEVAQAALQTEYGGSHAGDVEKELIHLAAVCIQWLECIERNRV